MSEVKGKPVTLFIEETIYETIRAAEKNLSGYLRKLVYRDIEQRGLLTTDELRRVVQ